MQRFEETPTKSVYFDSIGLQVMYGLDRNQRGLSATGIFRSVIRSTEGFDLLFDTDMLVGR